MSDQGGLLRRLLAKLRRRRLPAAPAHQEPKPARDDPGKLLRIDPFEPGGPFPAGRCARCAEAEVGRSPDFERRMATALAMVLDDAAAARWYAAQLAGGRLCDYRVRRVLARGRLAACSGHPIEVRVAKAYVRGELGRLARRCGLEAAPMETKPWRP